MTVDELAKVLTVVAPRVALPVDAAQMTSERIEQLAIIIDET